MKNNSDSFFVEQIRKFSQEKNKLRLLCLCEKIVTESVDCFGWYKCKKCKGSVHLLEIARRLS
jgi:hypothetical protein